MRALPVLALLAVAAAARAETAWLDRLDRARALESPGGLVRADLSGLLDLEGLPRERVEESSPGGAVPALDLIDRAALLLLSAEAEDGGRGIGLVKSRGNGLGEHWLGGLGLGPRQRGKADDSGDEKRREAAMDSRDHINPVGEG